jgi:chemotaxis protein CheX
VGSVTLTGAWVGRIEVRLTQGLAHEATVAMLMMPAESVGEADTLDATKEIANIIAGVIKSCMPRPTAMTVPEAAVEREPFADKPETESTLAVGFRHPSGDLLVRVCEFECAE